MNPLLKKLAGTFSPEREQIQDLGHHPQTLKDILVTKKGSESSSYWSNDFDMNEPCSKGWTTGELGICF